MQDLGYTYAKKLFIVHQNSTSPWRVLTLGTASALHDNCSLRGTVGGNEKEVEGRRGPERPGTQEKAKFQGKNRQPQGLRKIAASPHCPRWGTSAGRWRRSMVWPAAPMTHATTPLPSSPLRGSSMLPRSSTSQVGTPLSIAAWAAGHHFAPPSITPSGLMVRKPSPRAPLVLTQPAHP